MSTPTRFYGPARLTTTSSTKYTAPADFVSLVRLIRIVNPSNELARFNLSIGTDGATTRLFDGFVMPPNSILMHRCYDPLVEAEIIQAYGNPTNTLIITISGDLVPSDVG